MTTGFGVVVVGRDLINWVFFSETGVINDTVCTGSLGSSYSDTVSIVYISKSLAMITCMTL